MIKCCQCGHPTGFDDSDRQDGIEYTCNECVVQNSVSLVQRVKLYTKRVKLTRFDTLTGGRTLLGQAMRAYKKHTGIWPLRDSLFI